MMMTHGSDRLLIINTPTYRLLLLGLESPLRVVHLQLYVGVHATVLPGHSVRVDLLEFGVEGVRTALDDFQHHISRWVHDVALALVNQNTSQCLVHFSSERNSRLFEHRPEWLWLLVVRLDASLDTWRMVCSSVQWSESGVQTCAVVREWCADVCRGQRVVCSRVQVATYLFLLRWSPLLGLFACRFHHAVLGLINNNSGNSVN